MTLFPESMAGWRTYRGGPNIFFQLLAGIVFTTFLVSAALTVMLSKEMLALARSTQRLQQTPLTELRRIHHQERNNGKLDPEFEAFLVAAEDMGSKGASTQFAANLRRRRLQLARALAGDKPLQARKIRRSIQQNLNEWTSLANSQLTNEANDMLAWSQWAGLVFLFTGFWSAGIVLRKAWVQHRLDHRADRSFRLRILDWRAAGTDQRFCSRRHSDVQPSRMGHKKTASRRIPYSSPDGRTFIIHR